MKNSQNQKMSAIRQTLRTNLFTNRKDILNKKEELKNQSPPVKSVEKTKHVFRHFEDIYYLKQSKTIGEGAHAIVKRCYKKEEDCLNKSKIQYAVKVFRTGDPEILNTIRQTFQINRYLNDLGCVIKAHDLFINGQKEEVHFVMEYCKFQSLESLMIHGLPQVQVKMIIQALASAVDAIHQRGVCHRDLKPDNILIKINESSVDLKLIDFGVSRKFIVKGKPNSKTTKIVDMWTRTGTLLYQAPEIFQGGGYSEKIDEWSLGIIAYQLMCFGEFPFKCDSMMDTIEMILDLEYTVDDTPQFNLLGDLEKDLLRRMLKKNPDLRLSAADCCLHPWLKAQFQKCKTTSSDELDIQQFRTQELLNFNQSIQLDQLNSFQHFKNSDKGQQNVQIIDEADESQSPDISRRNSWKTWGNHVYHVPQSNQINMFSLQLYKDRQDLAGSSDLDQQIMDLQRTGSVQFDEKTQL